MDRLRCTARQREREGEREELRKYGQMEIHRGRERGER